MISIRLPYLLIKKTFHKRLPEDQVRKKVSKEKVINKLIFNHF